MKQDQPNAGSSAVGSRWVFKTVRNVAVVSGFAVAGSLAFSSSPAVAQANSTVVTVAQAYAVVTPAAAVPTPTAVVGGIQVTTSTAAPTTAPTVVKASPSVLGAVEEQAAEDVPFTGANSGTYTAVGAGLTAAGALLIAAARRRRNS